MINISIATPSRLTAEFSVENLLRGHKHQFVFQCIHKTVEWNVIKLHAYVLPLHCTKIKIHIEVNVTTAVITLKVLHIVIPT